MKSLLSSLRSGVKAYRETVESFSTIDRGPGAEYLENGYYGIHRAAYGNYSALYGNINLDRAFCLTAWLTCVKIISEDVGSLPLFINKLTGKSISVDRTHPLYNLLHDAPNPDMTALQFREAVTSHALTCGKGYARVERSKSDSSRIIALWPMMPYQIRRAEDSRKRPVFIETQPNGTTKTYSREEVFELTGFGTDGLNGLDMMRYAREAIGLGISQQEWAGRFFAQSQIPPLVLEHPLQTDVPAVKEAWEAAHKGASKWHAPAVLQEGMKANILQYDVSKTQLNEQRAFQLLEICRPFRMPPHKLGELGRATWGNIGAQNTQYLIECLRPWLVRWEQSINLFLLGKEHPTWYAEHEIGGMQRGDFTQQTEGFRTLLAAGVYSINEVRGLMNLNEIEGGDEHFIQINQGTVQQVAEGMTNEPQPAPVRVGGKP